MKARVYPFYFATGALALYLVFFVIPSLMGLFYAFTDWNSYTTEVNFVGLDNFRLIFSSGAGQNYLHFIRNTIIFTIVTIFLKTAFALALALLLTSGIRRLSYFHRVVMYLPAVLPILVVSLVFKSILNPATGLLNTFLRSVGLDFLAQRWLVDVHLALPSVIAVAWASPRIRASAAARSKRGAVPMRAAKACASRASSVAAATGSTPWWSRRATAPASTGTRRWWTRCAACSPRIA